MKAVRHVDEGGRPVEPREPNAVKFETFIFDALLRAGVGDRRGASGRRVLADQERRGRGLAGDRAARLNRMYARWLESAGVSVPRRDDGEPVDLEIDPASPSTTPSWPSASRRASLDGPAVIPPGPPRDDRIRRDRAAPAGVDLEVQVRRGALRVARVAHVADHGPPRDARVLARRRREGRQVGEVERRAAAVTQPQAPAAGALPAAL